MNKLIKNQIISVMQKTFNETIPTNPKNINRKEIKKWDSINHLHLILALEKQFNIRFKNSEVFDLLSFELILKSINKKINE